MVKQTNLDGENELIKYVTGIAALQSQKAVTAYFTSEKLLPFGLKGGIAARDEPSP